MYITKKKLPVIILISVFAVIIAIAMMPVGANAAVKKPGQVKNLVATASGTTISMSWSKVKGATGYYTYIKYPSDRGLAPYTKKVSTNKFVAKRMIAGKYYVKVRAFKTVKGKKYFGKYTALKKVDLKTENLRSWNIGAKNKDTAYSPSNVTSDVTATVNNAGELRIEGKGDTCVMGGIGTPPWAVYDWLIEKATIGDGVAPTNMDYWFERCYALNNINKIPDSVTSMVGTFFSCVCLKNVPAFPDTGKLTDISSAFADSAMVKAPDIPDSVVYMMETFAGTDITIAPTIGEKSSLKDMSGAFMATYIKKAPDIPEGVESINSTFEYCQEMTTPPKTIPESVTDITEAFAQCNLLTGSMDIEGNPVYYKDCFYSTGSDAAVGLTVGYTDKCKYIDGIEKSVSKNSNVVFSPVN